jgi:hypothetical protein
MDLMAVDGGFMVQTWPGHGKEKSPYNARPLGLAVHGWSVFFFHPVTFRFKSCIL